MLPSFPLCLEWLDFPPGYNPEATSDGSAAAGPSKTHGSYIAVGTFEPEIEIWSLDQVDGLYPDALLGRPDKSAAHVPTPSGTGKKKKRVLKERATSSEYHVDAVLGLAWNRSHRSLLASASADKTVKLWDLSRPSTSPAVRSFDLHTDKVQAVEWSTVEPTVLLTGSYDRTVRMWDTRTPKAGVGAMLSDDVEAVRWDPFEGHGFYVALESGLVLNYDARTLSSFGALKKATQTPAKFTLAAHEGAASSLDVSPHVRGCIATGGTDKMVKVWNIDEEDTNKRQVSMVTSRDVGVVRRRSRPDLCLCWPAADTRSARHYPLPHRARSLPSRSRPTRHSRSPPRARRPSFRSGTSPPTPASARPSDLACARLAASSASARRARPMAASSASPTTRRTAMTRVPPVEGWTWTETGV
jgi:periodic tryptophan protein 1